MKKKLSVFFLALFIIAVLYLCILRFTTGVDMTDTRFILEYWLEYTITILFLIVSSIFKCLSYID